MVSLKQGIPLLPAIRNRLFSSVQGKSSSSPKRTLIYLANSPSPWASHRQSIRFLFSASHSLRCAPNIDNMASGFTADRNLDYKSLIDRRSKGGKLIDVREKQELLEDGTIPDSYNIPVGELSNALTNLSNEEFKSRYGFEKPDVNDELIFSCRSGKRSLMAYSAAEKAGFKNIYNYAGGWLDWAKNTSS